MKLLSRPVYPVLLYITFCPLLSLSDFIMLCSIAIFISKLFCIFSTFLSILSFLFRPSSPVPSLLFAFPVSILLSHLPVQCCPARPSYSFLLSILVLYPAVCPVSCCPSYLLLSVLSAVLSVNPDLFCIRNSIQTYNAIFCTVLVVNKFLRTYNYFLECFSWTSCPRGAVRLSWPGYPVLL